MFEFIISLLSVAAIAVPAKPYEYQTYTAEAEEPYLEATAIVHKPDDYVLDIKDTLSDSVMDTSTSSIGHIEKEPLKLAEILALIKKYSVQYSVSYEELKRVIDCESDFLHEGIYGDNGLAYGIAQFHENTFNLFKKDAKMEWMEYKDLEDQIQLMAWSFAYGRQNHWTCWYLIKT
ncbi:MAG: hypothetical protein L6Q29_03440 [Candidatus Pacebacteria bacterium]|nr:hypothetical protein [Candidatus Paceibacterota bacterium]NUQ57511.1 hypothetical protein [Candidatus Paceibacter sp.]